MQQTPICPQPLGDILLLKARCICSVTEPLISSVLQANPWLNFVFSVPLFFCMVLLPVGVPDLCQAL